MTNREKATEVLAIIMEELNMPKDSTLGDVVYALAIIDPTNEILNLLKPLIRNAAIDEIQKKIA
jgi:ssRNA-specific RNase YbeY (16S rRNA maturation enzyme)